jgi:hypothetical protein
MIAGSRRHTVHQAILFHIGAEGPSRSASKIRSLQGAPGGHALPPIPGQFGSLPPWPIAALVLQRLAAQGTRRSAGRVRGPRRGDKPFHQDASQLLEAAKDPVLDLMQFLSPHGPTYVVVQLLQRLPRLFSLRLLVANFGGLHSTGPHGFSKGGTNVPWAWRRLPLQGLYSFAAVL